MLQLGAISGLSFLIAFLAFVAIMAGGYSLFSRRASGIAVRPISDSRAPGATETREPGATNQGPGSATGVDKQGTSDPQSGTR